MNASPHRSNMDRFLPDSVRARGDMDVVLRHRLVLTVALLLGIISPIFSVLNLMVPVWWPGTTAGALLSLVVWSIPLQTRWGVAPRVASLEILTALTACLAVVSGSLGGVFSPSVSWIAMAPALGLAMDGAVTALRSAMIAALAILVLGVLTALELVHPMEVSTEAGAILFTIGALAMAVILWMVGRAGEHVRTAAHEALHRTNEELHQEVDDHEKTRHRLHRVHQDLVDAAHIAGAAQLATGILHNLGNALNAVQVSTGLAESRLAMLRVDRVEALGKLMDGQVDDKVSRYANALGRELQTTRGEVRDELRSLREAVEHAVAIVATQQRHAVRTSVTERIDVDEMLRDAVSLCTRASRKVDLTVTSEPLPPVVIDRHRFLQIITNLVSNAIDALRTVEDGAIWINASSPEEGQLEVSVRDNGVGISPENLERVFAHGFTTRKDGHGFGLHASALAATELGGTLTAHSDGPGRGARFVIRVPFRAPTSSLEPVPTVAPA